MNLNQKNFQESNLIIKDKLFKYFLSPILVKNKFEHGFFTKTSSEINISFLSSQLNINGDISCKGNIKSHNVYADLIHKVPTLDSIQPNYGAHLGICPPTTYTPVCWIKDTEN